MSIGLDAGAVFAASAGQNLSRAVTTWPDLPAALIIFWPGKGVTVMKV
jgi:hypothetical protein